jgi:hypothetical protein
MREFIHFDFVTLAVFQVYWVARLVSTSFKTGFLGVYGFK